MMMMMMTMMMEEAVVVVVAVSEDAGRRLREPAGEQDTVPAGEVTVTFRSSLVLCPPPLVVSQTSLSGCAMQFSVGRTVVKKGEEEGGDKHEKQINTRKKKKRGK